MMFKFAKTYRGDPLKMKLVDVQEIRCTPDSKGDDMETHVVFVTANPATSGDDRQLTVSFGTEDSPDLLEQLIAMLCEPRATQRAPRTKPHAATNEGDSR